MSHVVVVGGGIAGLAAADALLAGGATVTLVEATGDVGGKLRVSAVGGVDVDEGAESFLRRRPEALDLIGRLGLAGDLVSPAVGTAWVWARGVLRPIPARTVMGVPSDPAALRGVLSAVEVVRVRADRLLPGAPPAADVAVGEWLDRRLGRAVVDRLVDPLLGGVYAGRARKLSLAATLPQLPRDERSALAAAGRALPPPAAPGAAPEPVFGTLTAGLGTLPPALAESIRARGGTILTDRTVRRLERTAAGWRVVHGPTTDEQAIDADGVVLALPAAPSRRLLADSVPAAAAELAGIDAASVAIVTTVWQRADARAPAGQSGYLVPAEAARPIKAVTFASAKWRHLDRDDLAVVRCSIGRHGDQGDLQRDDSDLVGAAVAELTTYGGFHGSPVASRVTRWGGGLPQYAVGHLDRVARIRAAVAGVPGLAVCGASYDGVGIPACISTGRLAAELVLASLRTPESR